MKKKSPEVIFKAFFFIIKILLLTFCSKAHGALNIYAGVWISLLNVNADNWISCLSLDLNYEVI